ncbi:MAG TPA: hypothetical protein VGK10_06280, partial [Prolixibacteraceae bacterium]
MHLKHLFSGLLILISLSIFAENYPIPRKRDKKVPSLDSVQLGIDYLKRYIQPREEWQSENPEILNLVKGLIHFAEDEHIDSVLVKLDRFQKQKDARYISRSPKFVSDSLQVRGYVAYPALLEKMKQLDREIWNGVDLKTVPLSRSMQAKLDSEPQPIAPGDERNILKLTGIVLPDSLVNVNAMPDTISHKANNFSQIKKRDQLRSQLLEAARVEYNKNIQNHLDAEISAYRNIAVRIYSDSLQNNLHDSLIVKNQQILAHYNDSIVQLVNFNFNQFVQTLQH